jgi:hypothetical protein
VSPRAAPARASRPPPRLRYVELEILSLSAYNYKHVPNRRRRRRRFQRFFVCLSFIGLLASESGLSLWSCSSRIWL